MLDSSSIMEKSLFSVFDRDRCRSKFHAQETQANPEVAGKYPRVSGEII